MSDATKTVMYFDHEIVMREDHSYLAFDEDGMFCSFVGEPFIDTLLTDRETWVIEIDEEIGAWTVKTPNFKYLGTLKIEGVYWKDSLMKV
jgi:hypothetical protein